MAIPSINVKPSERMATLLSLPLSSIFVDGNGSAWMLCGVYEGGDETLPPRINAALGSISGGPWYFVVGMSEGNLGRVSVMSPEARVTPAVEATFYIEVQS